MNKALGVELTMKPADGNNYWMTGERELSKRIDAATAPDGLPMGPPQETFFAHRLLFRKKQIRYLPQGEALRQSQRKGRHDARGEPQKLRQHSSRGRGDGRTGAVAVRLRGGGQQKAGTRTKAGLNAALCGASRRAGRPTA
ncbi:hypothetical protein [Streptomyces himalayensis]|uniref:Uncharacterized protein n=1 Tax=Streptomyces himalayensis subsp. himalayensis TaxID=2756131 RepID=A0A7W0DI06_9ACTN|nr:hypothetical protein [Streptomyces himalayensis]MBA2945491.1 hypothetical protein [Streptomyces himalayensis subsp. himalayensis]